jgi:hypothetical protein
MDNLTFEEKRLVLRKLLTRVVALPPTPEAPRGRVRLEGVLQSLSTEAPVDGDGMFAVTTSIAHCLPSPFSGP